MGQLHSRTCTVPYHGEHPQRDHRGEVEGADPRGDPQRLPHAVAVDARGHVLDHVAHLVRGRRARLLDDLEASEHVSARVRQSLALLRAVGGTSWM